MGPGAKTTLPIAGMAEMVLSAGGAHAASARLDSAGKVADGSDVPAIPLIAGNGVSARVLAYGAPLQSLIAPDPIARVAVTISCWAMTVWRPMSKTPIFSA